MDSEKKNRAPRNRTIVLNEADHLRCAPRLKRLSQSVPISEVLDCTVHQDALESLDFLPPCSVDLVFADPPYNLTKTFNGRKFEQVDLEQYEIWLGTWLKKIIPLLKPTASAYICGDWRSSGPLHRMLEKHFKIRNRITWEREKGRGARQNWKNSSEDIWFCTVSDEYTFNVEDVKMKRRVIAPYTDPKGQPKDWSESDNGRFRITHPSNLWTDLTVPFWSMPENTDHPTQKPEKLMAKIILASSNPGQLVLDPFLGSGTTSVVARKLGRHYIGIEVDETFCLLAEKRLEMAQIDTVIQGYNDGVFWERNTLSDQGNEKKTVSKTHEQTLLFL
jgi:site-specific DNA-methyltransferase (adenine-specific)